MLYQPGDRDAIEQPQESPYTLRYFFNEWIRPLAIMLTIVFVINLFFPRYYVLGRSMDPNLHDYDMVFVNSLAEIRRGDIVVLHSPRGDVNAIKRVIGLPTESVVIEGGVVYINGIALDEGYINEAPRYTGHWEIGSDEYFVLGDNRNASIDSADYGPIPRSEIRGTAQARFWPLNALEIFQTPTYPGLQPQ
jgi:signal peptidase I